MEQSITSARKDDRRVGTSASDWIVSPDEPILITGAAGFIGLRVVEILFAYGFRNLRCLVRPSTDSAALDQLSHKSPTKPRLQVVKGNLLSGQDCRIAAQDIKVIYHLAAGTGTDSFPDAFMNSVVTTRNLLEAALQQKCLRRFVNIGSFAVYTNRNKRRRSVLDESCPVEEQPELRGDAYCYAKMKQDEIVAEYGKNRGLPFVILRPGTVYGPGKKGVTGRVGLGTFGVFLHLGGRNHVPLTYVENCAEAIVLAGLKRGVEGEIINVVDDDLPSSKQILKLYKANVKGFKSIYIPKGISYLFFWIWEKYSTWSEGQLPPVFNRSAWHAYWKGSRYSNAKLKRLLGWSQRVPTQEGLKRYLEGCRGADGHA